MRVALRFGALSAILLLLAGCRDTAGPDPAILGNYVLVSVAGQPIPAVFAVTPVVTAIALAGELNLRADGQFLQRIQLEQHFAGEVQAGSRETTGSFSVRGQQITLRETGGERITGTLAGNEIRFSITLGEQQVELLWRR